LLPVRRHGKAHAAYKTGSSRWRMQMVRPQSGRRSFSGAITKGFIGIDGK
jgi:hypothetical protein